MTTLLIARFSALAENDTKKIVALSTLSQLGFMFISLAIGNSGVCTFHILIHALAKANLFIVVGVILHRRFSQQDTRAIASSIRSVLSFSILIRIVSLRGLIFTAGFFSKEQIIINSISIGNSLLSYFILAFISGLTVAYCSKLFISLSMRMPQSTIQGSPIRLTLSLPVALLTLSRAFLGNAFSRNLIIFPFLKLHRGVGGY